MAGYECADHLNCFGNRIDMLKLTGHDNNIEDDYKLLHEVGIRTVREGIRWSVVERIKNLYDWSYVSHAIHTARQQNIEQIWDLCHFGYPDDLSPLHPHFCGRFTTLCHEFAKLWKSESDDILFCVPINEVSFISWLGGDVKGTAPYCNKLGFEIKYELIRAYIQGIYAIKEILPDAKIIASEPLINVVPCFDDPHQNRWAADVQEQQFQVLEMLSGNMCPELGGNPELPDIIGLNYYPDNQWQVDSRRLNWEYPRDERWVPLSELLINISQRYDKPFFLSETSHTNELRGEWLREVTSECIIAMDAGVNFKGVCLYPVIDRPDWDDLIHHRTAGLWDLSLEPANYYKRMLCREYKNALSSVQFEVAKWSMRKRLKENQVKYIMLESSDL